MGLPTIGQTRGKAYHPSKFLRSEFLVPFSPAFFLTEMRMRSAENLQNCGLTKKAGRFQHFFVLSQRLYSAKQAIFSSIHAPWL
jgi:hypothetical protein